MCILLPAKCTLQLVILSEAQRKSALSLPNGSKDLHSAGSATNVPWQTQR
jgi:hypothetical protein